eukprot:g20794.t1
MPLKAKAAYYTNGDTRALLAEAPEKYALFVELLRETCSRPVEILGDRDRPGLLVGDIEFATRKVTLGVAKTKKTKRTWVRSVVGIVRKIGKRVFRCGRRATPKKAGSKSFPARKTVVISAGLAKRLQKWVGDKPADAAAFEFSQQAARKALARAREEHKNARRSVKSGASQSFTMRNCRRSAITDLADAGWKPSEIARNYSGHG